jgi:hypothetical protein
MTAQVNDSILYRLEKYAIAGINGAGLFQPEDHGITPVAISTGCWRGYYCTYEVVDASLRLKQLHIGLNEQDQAAAERCEGPLLFGAGPSYSESERCFVYDGLQELIAFTGGLLLGAEFIWDFYVHMGFHPAWKYRTVHELIFEQGRLIGEADRSKDMAQLREGMANRSRESTDPNDRITLGEWIARCFSRDYK